MKKSLEWKVASSWVIRCQGMMLLICQKIGLIVVDEEITMLEIIATLDFYNTEIRKSVFETLNINIKGYKKQLFG